MFRPQETPLGAATRGLVAGLVGTALMTAHQELESRLAASGSAEESSADDQARDPWEDAPTPAKVGRRIIEGVFQQRVPPDRIPLVGNAMHWGYGALWGSFYGLVQGTVRGNPLAMGALFGGGVWGMSYVQLVPMGLYEPPWNYPAKTLANELGYHLTYGLGVALGYRAVRSRTR